MCLNCALVNFSLLDFSSVSEHSIGSFGKASSIHYTHRVGEDSSGGCQDEWHSCESSLHTSLFVIINPNTQVRIDHHTNSFWFGTDVSFSHEEEGLEGPVVQVRLLALCVSNFISVS